MEGDDAYDENERAAIENFHEVKLDVTLALEDTEALPEALKDLIPGLQSSIRELVELFGDTSRECLQASNLLQKLKKYITTRVEEIDKAEKKRIREEREAREAAEEAERIRLAEEAEERRIKEEAEEKVRAYEREKRRRLEEYAASKLFQNQPCSFSMQTAKDLRVQLLSSVEFFNYACKDADFLLLVREFILDGFCRMYGKHHTSQHRMWLELIAACTLNANLPVFVDVDKSVQSGLGIACVRLSECIANARILPTGWALIDSNGLKTHVNHKTIELFKETSYYAQKVLLTICSLKIPTPVAKEKHEHEVEDAETTVRVITEESMLSPDHNHAKFLYLTENLLEYPSLEIACLSALALFKEVSTIKRSKLSFVVVETATKALMELVQKFIDDFEKQTKVLDTMSEMENTMKEAGVEYYNVLFKVTGKTDENDLDIPLGLYLQDNEHLKQKHTRFCKEVDKYGDLSDEYTEYKNDIIMYIVFLRLLYVLVSASVAVHFQFHSRAMKKTFFESSYRDFGEIKESDDILFQGLKKIPFGELFDIYHLEVEIFGDSVLTVFASTMCLISSEIQEVVGYHLYPSVVMDLVDKCKKSESLGSAYSTIHNSAVFSYYVLRGCNLSMKEAMLTWSNDEITPTWIVLFYEYARLMNRKIVVDDDSYSKEKIPVEYKTYHVLCSNNSWSVVDFVGSSKYSTLYELIKEYKEGLKLATSSHDLEELQVHEICTYISNCLEFLEERSHVNIQHTLSKFFEAPSHSLTYQSSITILDSLILLMSEDWTSEYFKLIHTEFEIFIDLMIEFLRESTHDHLISKVLIVLTTILSGYRPLYHHPSMKDASTSSSSQNIIHTQHLFASKIMEKYKIDFEVIITNLAAKWLYSLHPKEHLMSIGPDGACLVTILIRFMTSVTYAGDFDTSSQLRKAVSEAKYYWPDIKPWDSWLAFFMVGLVDGICGLLRILQKNYPNNFQIEVFDEDDQQLSQCDDDLRCSSIELMTALCIGPFHLYQDGNMKPNVNSDFCDYLIKNEYSLRGPLLTSLELGNDGVKACIFNFVAILITHERMIYPDHVLNLQSYMNMFRLAVGYEGNFIKHMYDCVDNACSQIQLHIGPVTERHIDNSSSENFDDKDKSIDGNIMSEVIVDESSPIIFPPPAPEQAMAPIQFEKKKVIKLLKSSVVKETLIKSPTMTNQSWEDVDAYISCVTAIDALLMSFECLTEMCEGRKEFLDIIAENYPGFFIHLPCCFSKLHSFKQHNSYLRTTKIMSGYHAELVKISAKTLQVLLKRAPVNRKHAVRAGCIEALMDSILQCLELYDTNLLKHLVHTMEILVLRDVESWNYLKSVSGIQGLLTLMKAGNCALQISSCSSITTLANGNVAYIEALLETDVLDALNVLLLSNHVSVKFSALGLFKVLSSVKSGRTSILKNHKYMTNLGNLLNSGDDLTVVQSVCEVLNLLGTDTDVGLRKSLVGAKEFDPNQAHSSRTKNETVTTSQLPPINIVSRLMEMSTGEVFSKKVKVSTDIDEVKIVNFGLSNEDYVETGLIQSVCPIHILKIYIYIYIYKYSYIHIYSYAHTGASC